MCNARTQASLIDDLKQHIYLSRCLLLWLTLNYEVLGQNGHGKRFALVGIVSSNYTHHLKAVVECISTSK